MNFNPFDMLKNATAFKEQMRTIKKELDQVQVEGTSGGGLVTVTLDGQFFLRQIVIDPVAVDPRDVSMLQDLIRAAHTAAVEKIRDEITKRLGPLAEEAGFIF